MVARCGWPEPAPVRPELEPLPPGCIARCDKGHPVSGTVTKHRKAGKVTYPVEVTYHCRRCSTKCVVTARGCETMEVPQRELLFPEPEAP